MHVCGETRWKQARAGVESFSTMGRRTQVGREQRSHRFVLVKLNGRLQRGSSKREEPTAGGLPRASKADVEMLPAGASPAQLWGTLGGSSAQRATTERTVKKAVGAIGIRCKHVDCSEHWCSSCNEDNTSILCNKFWLREH